jgi:hypothetical protein
MTIFSSWWSPIVGDGGTTRQPLGPNFAIVQYLRISEYIWPDFFDGCLPVRRWLAAVLQAVFACCVAAQDLVLYRLCVLIAPSEAFGLRTELMDVCTKLQIVQGCVPHDDGFLDCMSLTAFRLALPLTWSTSTGILLMLVMKLFMRALALNLPFLMRLTASFTGLLSGAMSSGCFDSLMMSISACMPVANASASISQGDHFLQ